MKKRTKQPTEPYYVKRLKNGPWVVFDAQQRMHGSYTNETDANMRCVQLLIEHDRKVKKEPCQSKNPAPSSGTESSTSDQ